MPDLKPILAELSNRYERVLTGLDVAFDDAEASRVLRDLRGGVWMTVVSSARAATSVADALPEGTVHQICDDGSLPFDDCPFEVVVLNGSAITQPLVKEIHRVLKPAGFLFFTVDEEDRGKRDSTLSKIYNMFLKNGFDIVSLVRPPWWKFGFGGRTLTVCARRKAWKEHKSLGGVSMIRSLALVAVSLCALSSVAGPMGQSEAMVRLLNSSAAQGPRLFEAAAERVASDAKVGLPLQRFMMAVHPELPEKYRLDEATRKEYLEGSRPKIRQLAEQRDNPLAWYLLALETDDIELLERAAAGGNVQAMNAWGTLLLEKGEYDKAFERFKASAAKKDANGLYNLGMCHMQGVGGEPNEKLAFECFRTAADMGHPQAINNIGGCYRDGIVLEKSAEMSAKWFAKSADLGDMYGQLNYALALQHGEGVSRDEAKAAELLKASAAQGCPEAMNVYGMCFFSGLGVERNPMLAVAWFRRSAAEGFPPAMDNLAECYDRGVGVEKSAMTSTVWKMRSRAARGDKAAAEWLETISPGGE